ncbi:erythropoiesis-stimulating protein [Kitasatospora sp. MMS16-BH015]|uniref:helix-turn-helix domain-containing protein n=1 Tax=Kitasatospora sp. MMS16-BH015 TaxID=2018025 RepID=UPI000CA28231|nr:helix-turn-helix transcriptional regulator [Kitasatospora sp. MMS16-BH015]AUG78431.1 erythropoiesis-stimulating protein [Kitasatospora sp. MMS16-BH015]
MLELLGLDATTEVVYRALLSHPRSEAAALAEQLALSPETVRKAWRTLADLALVRYEPDSSEPPRLVGPDIALEHLLARREAELAERQERLAATRAAAAVLLAEHAEQQPAAGPVTVEHLADLGQIRDRLKALTDNVVTEVMAFAPGGAQTAANMAAARPLNEQLLGRGVQMRTVYLDSLRNDSATVAHAKWLTEQGGQVRTAAVLPLRMTVIDRATAVIPADPEDTSTGAVVISGQPVLVALCALFETVWEEAQPLGAVGRPERPELDRQESAALRLLAEGHTDETIAKRMGVSHRTARRIATALMEKLDARSRFEAGVHAAQRGWLPKTD